MAGNRPLKSFRLLSFDIYGTLIDWEAGILESIKPLATRLDDSCPLKSNPAALLTEFAKFEREAQHQNPDREYPLLLKQAYENLAKELQVLPPASEEGGKPGAQTANGLLDAESTACGASIPSWGVFKDTVSAMRRLKRHGYKLVPVSNVDNASFSKALHEGPLSGVYEGLAPGEKFFDAIYTAQDIGSYKPDLRNFEYLISHVKSEFGVEKSDILHVAQSLYHDHEPAKKIGLFSAWIARGEDGESSLGGDVEEYTRGGESAKVAFGWKFKNLAELADAIDAEGA